MGLGTDARELGKARAKSARREKSQPAPAIGGASGTVLAQSVSIAPPLLAWYDAERRQLPWRYDPGVIADPYRVWLSEIMLQQTTVRAVIPFYEAFLQRWPTAKALAKAPLDDVLAAWAGLGYYSRARNLHACAKVIAKTHRGKFPSTEAELRALPGIGSYTAAAIASIAFGQRATVVDGNVERVVSRLFAVEAPLPRVKPELKKLADTLTPDARAGDYAQAMMDLGATICTPRRPSCLMCPIHAVCRANALGLQAALPRRAAKAERPQRFGTAFVVLREDGAVLLRKRPPEGLLGGMLEVPTTAWTGNVPSPDTERRAQPVRADWWPVAGAVTHVFTHFRLDLFVQRALVPKMTTPELWADPARCQWVQRDALHAVALPSLMRKVIQHAMG